MAEAALTLARRVLPVSRVLLVEDDASDVFLIRHTLGELTGGACELHHATTQAEAVVAAAAQHFDVCLLDMNLPDASGFSALIDLQDKAPHLPVLILTARNDTDLARQAVARGAQDYLLKDHLGNAEIGRAVEYAIERKRLEQDLMQRANCDALTGLANRSLFENRLQLALTKSRRSGEGVAVLFLDLDRFKAVNDAFGHEAGDAVLKEVAARFKTVLRGYDTVARFGGDEFAVLLEGIDNPRNAAVIAQKLVAALGEPVLWQGHVLEVGASVGIAVAGGNDTAESMLQQADAAMYRAKADPAGRYQFYTPSLQQAARARLQAEGDLRQALEQGALHLVYQPVIRSGCEQVLGAEALLRWEHPARGTLLPADFIGTAEELRLMPAIGQWIFGTVCRDLKRWKREHILLPQVAVNLSASQLAADAAEWLEGLLHREKIAPRLLALELGEPAMSALSAAQLQTLGTLHDIGVALHMDHFGAGALSLRALHTLPLSVLKFDLGLIRQMGGDEASEALIRTSVALAHQLGLKAGAVGVEAAWQQEVLARERCDFQQGYLIGRPMTAARLSKWLAKAAR